MEVKLKNDWMQQRELCQRCKHFGTRENRPNRYGTTVGMVCHISRLKNISGIGSCIHERDKGQCGPDGKLFEPKDVNGQD